MVACSCYTKNNYLNLAMDRLTGHYQLLIASDQVKTLKTTDDLQQFINRLTQLQQQGPP